MKRFIIILLSSVIIVACNDSEPDIKLGGKGLSFDQSQSAWVQLKEKKGNSYEYTIGFQSWTGTGNSTILTVQDGVVISRAFEAYTTNDDGTREITETYQEGAGQLGTHENGAAIVTIDDLYDTCISSYLSVDDEENSIYFSTSDYGIMSTCGYSLNGCADDCFRGIRITEFEWR